MKRVICIAKTKSGVWWFGNEPRLGPIQDEIVTVIGNSLSGGGYRLLEYTLPPGMGYVKTFFRDIEEIELSELTVEELLAEPVFA